MKNFWFLLEIIEGLILLIGGSIGVLSFIICILACITGTEHSAVGEISSNIFEFIINYIYPIFMVLFVVNGLHALDWLVKNKTKQD